jgi:predicted nuclease of predicted toxin-antitoxin system
MATVAALRNAGDKAAHLREQGLHRLSDESILKKAAEERAVVITFDLDFGELLAAAGAAMPSVILFRMRDHRPEFVNLRLFQVLAECREVLHSGAMIIVEDQGYRVRRLPIRPPAD